MKDEVWRPVAGYEGRYEVSNYGRVKSPARKRHHKTGCRMYQERVLKISIINGGYAMLTLQKNGVRKGMLAHRLVAEAFVPNHENKPYVNHIDGNKLNNRADNLEWCTAKENMVHSVENGLRSDLLPIDMLSKGGELIRTFKSVREAERETGIYRQNIIGCCKSRRTSTGGYIWKYHLEESEDNVSTR